MADVDDDGAMSRSLKVVFAVASGVVALVSAGVVLVVLRQDDLATAGVWAAVAGVVATLVTGSVSAVLAWAAWRHPRGAPVPGQEPVPRTGGIVQKKTSGTTIANSGYLG